MITVEQALEPLYTIASQYEYRLTYVYTTTDYRADPLLQTPSTEFRLDKTLHKPKTVVGPAAE
jgi:hypothetical protein